jgi:signal transduction histidine kinase/CheY-like chemotaxis protein
MFIDPILPSKLSLTLFTLLAEIWELDKLYKVEINLYSKNSKRWYSGAQLGPLLQCEVKSLTNFREPIFFAGIFLGEITFSLTSPLSPETYLAFKESALHAGIIIANGNFTNQVERLTKSIAESVHAKTGFLASLSHELRGPLGLMLNTVELILEEVCGTVHEEQKKLLQVVQRNTLHLLDLMNDVLDYAKIEVDAVKVYPESVSWKEMISEIGLIIRSGSLAKDQKLIIEDAEKDFSLWCDRRQLRQILINLLTNSVKYTLSRGEIRVGIREKPLTNEVVVTISDTGIGIAKEDRGRIFHAFTRLENDHTKRVSGTGLGLNLVKSLVHLNGGEIDFDSKLNEGSTFWFTLPLASTAPKQTFPLPIVDQTVLASLLEASRPHILLWGGTIEETTILDTWLKEKGHQTTKVFELADALEVSFDGTNPGVIIADDSAGRKEIEDYLAAFLERPKLNKPKIIVLSSDAFASDIERYIRAGAERCLIKPVRLKELYEACRLKL